MLNVKSILASRMRTRAEVGVECVVARIAGQGLQVALHKIEMLWFHVHSCSTCMMHVPPKLMKPLSLHGGWPPKGFQWVRIPHNPIFLPRKAKSQESQGIFWRLPPLQKKESVKYHVKIFSAIGKLTNDITSEILSDIFLAYNSPFKHLSQCSPAVL